jgi:predicted DNA-binding protein YlxM (UPF0122 family)
MKLRIKACRGQGMELRQEFENLGPALETVCSRSRGVFKRGRRPSEPPVRDSRGRGVRCVAFAQTFLSAGQVDELVALYRQGATLLELGERFGIHKRTAAAHLVRMSVPMRQRGLTDEQVPQASRLYQDGLSLVEVGLRFGVSGGAVRRALMVAGVAIRRRNGWPTRAE